MPYDLDDPRLTAYALGELDDPGERAAVEAQLADDPESRRFVEEVRATAELLTEELRAESGPGLHDTQRHAIETRLADDCRPTTGAVAPYRTPWYAYAVAASLLVSTGLLALRATHVNLVLDETTAQDAAAFSKLDAPPGSRMGTAEPAADVAMMAPAAPAPPSVLLDPAPTGTDRSNLATAAGGRPAADAAGLAEAPGLVPSAGETIALHTPSEELAQARRVPKVALRPKIAREPAASASFAQPDQLEQTAPPVPAEPAGGYTGMMGMMMGAGGIQGPPAPGQAPPAMTTMSSTGMMGGMGGGMGGAGMMSGTGGYGGMMGSAFDQPQRGRGAVAFGAAAPESPGPEAAVRDESQLMLNFAPESSAAATPELTALPQQPMDAVASNYATVPGLGPSDNQPPSAAAPAGAAVVERLQERLSAVPVPVEEAELAVKKLDLAGNAARPHEGPTLDQPGHDVRQRVAPPADAPVRMQFRPIQDNPFVRVMEEPLSTFSIDVDTASYAIVRRYLLDQNLIPPPDAVRIEEMINAFRYDYPEPGDADVPFYVDAEIARCPWNAEHRLARIGLRGRSLASERRPPGNLVFLVDVSGSMNRPDKLPLLKVGLRMLAEQMQEGDRVAIVTYADKARVALDSTPAERKDVILRAIDALQTGGSTNGGDGIELAYDIAARNFEPEGTNRVILATDGDFNVGVTDDGSLVRLIAEKAKSKVFLSVLGFGSDNLQDAKLEAVADRGNGHYHYIDTEAEARKVLVEQLAGTLVTIAKDVKIQVDFNPAKVAAYRLIGYEDRLLAAQDFHDDTKDAGEIGAGHSVTALYELVPPGREADVPAAERSKYVQPAAPAMPDAPESFTIRLRYKLPKEDQSRLSEHPVIDDSRDYAAASDDTKFAAAVAAFGMILRHSPHAGNATLDAVLELAEAGRGRDPEGDRSEFLSMVRKARELMGETP